MDATTSPTTHADDHCGQSSSSVGDEGGEDPAECGIGNISRPSNNANLQHQQQPLSPANLEKSSKSLLSLLEKGLNRVLKKISSQHHASEAYHNLQRPPISSEGHDPCNAAEFSPRPAWHAAAVDVLWGIFTSSYLNLLLIFVPIGLACYFVEAGAILTFILNGLAIVPLSALLTDATERVAAHCGNTLGALLNVTLGNLVELILLVALANGHVRVVQASLLGSVLVNLLLILGSALLVASTYESTMLYNTTEAQLLACLLFVSVFTFIMPSAFDRAFDHSEKTAHVVLKMTRLSSLLVLGIYVLYFVHELRHERAPADNGHYRVTLDLERNQHGCHHEPSGVDNNSGSLVLPPRTIRFADEHHGASEENTPAADPDRFELESMTTTSSDDDDSVADDQNSFPQPLRGRRLSFDTEMSQSIPNSHQPLISSRAHSRSLSLTSNQPSLSRDSSVAGDRIFARSGLTSLHLMRDNRLQQHAAYGEVALPRVGATVEMVISLVVLVFSSVVMSMNADLLVSSIDEVTQQSGLSSTFIGLVILPIVGNISEYVTVVTVAVNHKMDLAIAVAVGSSIQIALCVTPIVVIAGWILHVGFSLTFNVFELTVLFGTVLLVNLLILNDSSSTLKTSGLKGALLCVCYGLVGLGAFFAPETQQVVERCSIWAKCHGDI